MCNSVKKIKNVVPFIIITIQKDDHLANELWWKESIEYMEIWESKRHSLKKENI